jgi:hypothetical protein
VVHIQPCCKVLAVFIIIITRCGTPSSIAAITTTITITTTTSSSSSSSSTTITKQIFLPQPTLIFLFLFTRIFTLVFILIFTLIFHGLLVHGILAFMFMAVSVHGSCVSPAPG